MSVGIQTTAGTFKRCDTGTTVIANPDLSGTEDSLESLQVGSTIYKVISDEEKASWNGKADKTLVSDAWDNTKSYVIGDYCIYNDSLWKCLANNSNITPTEGTYWTSVSIAEQFGGLRFGFDGDGNYGYYKVGADTLTPFKSGSSEQEVVYNTGGVWQGGDHTQTGTYTAIKKGVAIIMLGATHYSGGRTSASSLTKNGVSIDPSNTFNAGYQMRRVYITEVEVGDVLSMSVTGRVDTGAYSGQVCWTSLCIVMV